MGQLCGLRLSGVSGNLLSPLLFSFSFRFLTAVKLLIDENVLLFDFKSYERVELGIL